MDKHIFLCKTKSEYESLICEEPYVVMIEDEGTVCYDKLKITVAGYEFIDMGTSVLWATCNIGARKPEECGHYFMWGDPEAYRADRTPVSGSTPVNFDWIKYKWSNGTNKSLTKYCVDSSYGEVDNKSVLDLDDDPAFVRIVDETRSPTEEEFKELIDACSTAWVTNYNDTGVNGMLFTSKTGASQKLFFPASGNLGGLSLNYGNTNGFYWSKSIHTDYSSDGWCLYFGSGHCSMNGCYRCEGMPVRAVLPK